MILFPAIDLKDGQAVRLEKGEMEKATVFNTDPVAQARAFVDAGCEWIHVVDLNGAFAGHPVNGEAVMKIRESVKLPLQLGGGIRNMETIERWLGLGIARVVLGTAALRDPDLVRAACREYPGKIAVGVDARAGQVAVEGWAETSETSVSDLAERFADCGVAAIIYTDIDRDGVLAGPNLKATQDLAEKTSIPVIASGGIASLEDLLALAGLESKGVIGAISGRAIYDGRIDLAHALDVLKGKK